MLANALRHHQSGRLPEAERIYRQILRINTRHADSLHLLGVIQCQRGRPDLGADLIGQALRLASGNAIYQYNMGNALHATGRLDEAVAHFERALAANPNYADAHNSLGAVKQAQGKIADAATHYQRALALNPGNADVHNNLANIFKDRGLFREALAHYERALALNPQRVEVHYNLAGALLALGRIDEALAHYRRAVALKPDYADAHNNLGSVLLSQGKLDEAIAHCERAVAINPDHAEAHNNLGNLFAMQARFADAHVQYARAIAIRPDYTEPHFNRAEIKTFQPGDAELAALEALADRQDLPPNQTLYIHFALGKALEDCGDYDRAFAHLAKANTLKRSLIAYDELTVVRRFHRIATVFSSRLLDHFRGEGDPSSVPVFVLGMPRSGSTLIEQILASHPQMHGAGELSALSELVAGIVDPGNPTVPYPECVAGLTGDALRRLGQAYLARLPAVAPGQVRIIDKYPSNFLSIGLIRLILPNARIIHTMRNPVDTCVSCYSKLFTRSVKYSYDLGELGRYYYCYRAMMSHWRSVLPPGAMLDVAYEDVVDDLEGQARRMIDYCGLPWDDRCLSFHRSKRAVRTASVAQVRKPVYRSSLARWRRYEKDLGPLLRELEPLPAG